MNYSEYTSNDTIVKEYYIITSDNISLKIIDFIPSADSFKKPLILFVAGWISHISGWKDVLKEITPEFRTVYIETREKISSIIPYIQNVSFSMERLTEDIMETINKIIPGKKDFIMAGSSLGATVILEYLSLNIRNPKLAILIAPTPEFIFPKVIGNIIPMLPAAMYIIIKPFIKWYLKNFKLDKKKEIEQVKKYEYALDCADPFKLRTNALAIKNYTIWDKLYKIISPVIIIGATSDYLHGTDKLKRLSNSIKNSRYKELSSNKETHSRIAGKLITGYIKDYLK